MLYGKFPYKLETSNTTLFKHRDKKNHTSSISFMVCLFFLSAVNHSDASQSWTSVSSTFLRLAFLRLRYNVLC